MLHAPIPSAFAPAVAIPAGAVLPLPFRTPARRLAEARQDHAICLRLAADYRLRLSRGERGLRDQHAWALGHARTLRLRFPGLLSATAA